MIGVRKEIDDAGLISRFEVIGSPDRGITMMRSRALGITVLEPFQSWLVDEGDWRGASEISQMAPEVASVHEIAANIWKRSPKIREELRLAGKSWMRGGIQWCRHVSFKAGVRLEWAVQSDITEAYTTAMLRRTVPTRWVLEENPEAPRECMPDIDTAYLISCEVPKHLPWGFPTAQHKPGTTFEGWAFGEEIMSAKVRAKVYLAYRPTEWSYVNGGDTVLGLQKGLRKRVGNVLYGLHAKRRGRIRGVPINTVKPGDQWCEDPNDRKLAWVETAAVRPFQRTDWASITTARTRAALHRAALSVKNPVGLYVDGLLADDEPFGGRGDTWFSGLIEWRKVAEGPCLVYGPSLYEWSSGHPTRVLPQIFNFDFGEADTET